MSRIPNCCSDLPEIKSNISLPRNSRRLIFVLGDLP